MLSLSHLAVRPASPQAAREVRRNTPLRQARTCYGHLAGVAGVRLMEELLGRGWIEEYANSPEGARLLYAPTAKGFDALARRGVELPSHRSGKPIAHSCVDWTERYAHLGGKLGRAIVDALVRSGCIYRMDGSRVVTVTGGLDSWLEC